MILGPQLFNHRKPISNRPDHLIGRGDIIIALTLSSDDLLDGMTCLDFTQKRSVATLEIEGRHVRNVVRNSPQHCVFSHTVWTMARVLRFWSILFISLFSVTSVSVLAASPSQAIIPKISVSPTTFSLAEGLGTQISATMDEPIMCPSHPSLPCSVILNFAASVPSGVSLTNSSIEWAQAEWSQTKTFTVSLTDPSLFDNNEVFHLVAVAESRSEYYSGFSVDIAVTVAVTQTTTTTFTSTTTNVATTTTTPPSTTTPSVGTLPATGRNSAIAQFAMWAFIVGIALTFRRKLRQTK